MKERIFGIMRRAYYLVAVIITVIGIFWTATTCYTYHQESKYHGEWSWVPTLEKDAHPTLGGGYVIFADTYVEIDKKFITMSKERQDKDVKEIQDALYPRSRYEWFSIFFIFLTLPIAWLLHKTAHWVIWGKVK
jgi:hypothetical protein